VTIWYDNLVSRIRLHCSNTNTRLYSTQAFGGDLGDQIEGNEGQDIILGDFGEYNASEEFLPFQHFRSIIIYPEFAGDDTIFGGDNDDILMGQEVCPRQ